MRLFQLAPTLALALTLFGCCPPWDDEGTSTSYGITVQGLTTAAALWRRVARVRLLPPAR